MAKRGKSGYSSAADDDPGEDYSPEDSPSADIDNPADKAGSRSRRTVTDERPGNYEVVEPGTIIDGIYYPKDGCPAGQEMRVYLDDFQAQGLANGGVKLKSVDTGEVVQAEEVALKEEQNDQAPT